MVVLIIFNQQQFVSHSNLGAFFLLALLYGWVSWELLMVVKLIVMRMRMVVPMMVLIVVAEN